MKYISLLVLFIAALLTFNSCSGGGSEDDESPDTPLVKITCINDYHDTDTKSQGFSLCIEKVTQQQCRNFSEPDETYRVNAYAIHATCSATGFPKGSLEKKGDLDIYTLLQPLDASEGSIIGGKSSSSISVAIFGGKDLHIAVPNGVKVDMRAKDTDGQLTTITMHDSKESTNLDSLDEEEIATILDIQFDSFTPEDYGLDAVDFTPKITIPKSFVAGYDIDTLSVFRISDMFIDGKIVTKKDSNLPITVDKNGDLIVNDFYFPDSIKSSLAYAKTTFSRSVNSADTFTPNHIRYVVGTFYRSANWKRTPQLSRMHINPKVKAYRSEDVALSNENITDIIVFVHGHNETEKTGIMIPADAGVRNPWYYQYKRDVWTPFYKYIAQKNPSMSNCTAYYEFVYPTYRPIFSETKDVSRLDRDFAKAVNNLVSDTNGGNINLYIVAHSMGGLVARAGIQLFDSTTQSAFKKLVTWGSPHWGSALVSLRYALGSVGYAYNYRGNYSSLLGGDISQFIVSSKIDKLQIDSPGARDIRRARSHTSPRDLALIDLFEPTIRIVNSTYLWNKYNLTNGTDIYNDNLTRLNENDLYKSKSHALFGITTKSSIYPSSSDPEKGAYIIPALLRNADAPYGAYKIGDNDGAVSIVSISGENVVGDSSNVGDINHEEYFKDPTLAEKMVLKTLTVLNIKACDVAPIKSCPMYLDLALDPDGNWQVEINSVDKDGDGRPDDYTMCNYDFLEPYGLKEEVPMINEMEHGLYKGYQTVDGAVVLRSTIPYINDKREGVAIDYFFNSNKVEWETPWVNGKVNGNVVRYDDDGSIYSCDIYRDDKIIGSCQ